MTIHAVRFTHLGNFSRTATTLTNGQGVVKRSVDLTLPNGNEVSREKTITKTDTGATIVGSITTDQGTLNYTRIRKAIPPVTTLPIPKDPQATTEPVNAGAAEEEKLAANDSQPIKVGPGQEPGPTAPLTPKNAYHILPIKVGPSGPFVPYTPTSFHATGVADQPISLYPVDETV